MPASTARPPPPPLVQLAMRRYDLDLPAALREVVDDERDDNEDDRERKKPGPPAVSCDEHIDLRCGVRPITERPCASSIYLRLRRAKLSPTGGAVLFRASASEIAGR